MDNTEELISVIVPIYNVYEYLSCCIESILHQTYKILEIILVDDGSTDGSERICNQYANNDHRVKVIHQPNAGLASARNTGIANSNGNILSFVDSDDLISSNMINELYCLMKSKDADIVCCNYAYVDQNNNVISVHKTTASKLMELNSNQANKLLLYDDYYKCYAWNKIYRKRLFDGIHYPDGKLYEDIQTTYKLFNMSNKIVYYPKALYYYRLRDNSITLSKFSHKNLQILNPINYIWNDSNDLDIKIGCLLYYFGFIQSAIDGNVFDQKYFSLYKNWFDQVKLYIYRSPLLSNRMKLNLFLCRYNFKFYKNIHLRRNNKRKLNIGK